MRACWALWLILAAGFGAMLWLNLPGHLSVDSVLALREGRFGVRETWNPAIFGWLLGRADQIRPGAAAVVVASGTLAFGSLAILPLLRPRTSWLAPAVALIAVGLPQLILYPAIVWKDVLFAVAMLAAFVALAFSLRRGPGRAGGFGMALAAVLIAVASLLRQNGLLIAVPAAVAIGGIHWPLGARRATTGAVAWLAVVIGLTLTINALAQPQGAGKTDEAGAKGLRILQMYDIVGAAALQPGRATPRIDRAYPAAGRQMRSAAAQLYSTERVDTLAGDLRLNQSSYGVPRAVIQAEWLDLIRSQPGLYARVRLGVFRQVLATPSADRCLPVFVGVVGPASALADLRIPARHDRRDQRLYNYVTWHLDTPSMSHLTFAAIALLVAGLLLIRRQPADLVIAAMMAAALGFTASFFVISIACDYRYLYVLDLSAITGLLYLALDPRIRPRSAARSVV